MLYGMNGLTLTSADIIALKQAHRACKDKRAAERLWKFMKKKVLDNKYYEKFDIFKEVTLDFFEKIQQYKPELDSLLTSNFRLLNAN